MSNINNLFSWNFSFAGNGGAVFWSGNKGILSDCSFINNSVNLYNVTNANNVVNNGGGAIYWNGTLGNLNNCVFINNSFNVVGVNSTNVGGGGVCCDGSNLKLVDSTFINNNAGAGGAIYLNGYNDTVNDSTFINNTASRYGGGAIYINNIGSIIDCSFTNSKSHLLNGIYATKDLNIDGGKGMVYVFINGTLSGISIMVLNNETYYYPPNTNINLPNKKEKK